MSRQLIRGFYRFAALGLLATLCLSSPALALFPPPYYTPPGNSTGDPDPPPPPVDPPCEPPVEPPPPCPPGNVNATPEPATMISGLVGLTVLGGCALRRKFRK